MLFHFSFLCHCSASSALGNKPVKYDDLPMILGNSRTEEGKQSQDFEVNKLALFVQYRLGTFDLLVSGLMSGLSYIDNLGLYVIVCGLGVS